MNAPGLSIIPCYGDIKSKPHKTGKGDIFVRKHLIALKNMLLDFVPFGLAGLQTSSAV